MKRNAKSIRFDERTWMLLQELSHKTGRSISVIVRSIVMHSIEQWLDKAGEWRQDAEKEDE
jgi:predicted DNA-binding protein